MALQDSLDKRKPILLQAQDQALVDFGSGMYSDGLADQKAADGTQTTPADQQVIDDLKAQLKAALDKDAADIASGQQALADLQAKFDQMAADKKVEDGVIAGLQAAKDQLAAVLASLSAIGQPPAPPAPAP